MSNQRDDMQLESWCRDAVDASSFSDVNCPSSFTAINHSTTANFIASHTTIESAPQEYGAIRHHDPTIAHYLGFGAETDASYFDRFAPPPSGQRKRKHTKQSNKEYGIAAAPVDKSPKASGQIAVAGTDTFRATDLISKCRLVPEERDVATNETMSNKKLHVETRSPTQIAQTMLSEASGNSSRRQHFECAEPNSSKGRTNAGSNIAASLATCQSGSSSLAHSDASWPSANDDLCQSSPAESIKKSNLSVTSDMPLQNQMVKSRTNFSLPNKSKLDSLFVRENPRNIISATRSGSQSTFSSSDSECHTTRQYKSDPAEDYSVIVTPQKTNNLEVVYTGSQRTSMDLFPWECDAVEADASFDDGINDDDLLMCMTDTINKGNETCQEPKEGDEQCIDLTCSSSRSPIPPQRGPSSRFVSPVTAQMQLCANKVEDRKRIVRAPFPPQVCDRSLIIGLSAESLSRTCFRVGEAINAASIAVKSRQDVLIELYARVLSSSYDEYAQQFVFCDLYSSKPPYLKGKYATALWRCVPLYEYDAGRLQRGNKICRCIGKMKRTGKEWILVVLNIWEAKWEDIEWVQGIVNP